MSKTAKRSSRMDAEIVETVQGFARVGIMPAGQAGKITMKLLGKNGTLAQPPLTGEQIKAIRELARMSQAVFARHLNVTAGYLSQLERDTRKATGSTLAMLNVVRRKGIGAIT